MDSGGPLLEDGTVDISGTTDPSESVVRDLVRGGPSNGPVPPGTVPEEREVDADPSGRSGVLVDQVDESAGRNVDDFEGGGTVPPLMIEYVLKTPLGLDGATEEEPELQGTIEDVFRKGGTIPDLNCPSPIEVLAPVVTN